MKHQFFFHSLAMLPRSSSWFMMYFVYKPVSYYYTLFGFSKVAILVWVSLMLSQFSWNLIPIGVMLTMIFTSTAHKLKKSWVFNSLLPMVSLLFFLSLGVLFYTGNIPLWRILLFVVLVIPQLGSYYRWFTLPSWASFYYNFIMGVLPFLILMNFLFFGVISMMVAGALCLEPEEGVEALPIVNPQPQPVAPVPVENNGWFSWVKWCFTPFSNGVGWLFSFFGGEAPSSHGISSMNAARWEHICEVHPFYPELEVKKLLFSRHFSPAWFDPLKEESGLFSNLATLFQHMRSVCGSMVPFNCMLWGFDSSVVHKSPSGEFLGFGIVSLKPSLVSMKPTLTPVEYGSELYGILSTLFCCENYEHYVRHVSLSSYSEEVVEECNLRAAHNAWVFWGWYFTNYESGISQQEVMRIFEESNQVSLASLQEDVNEAGLGLNFSLTNVSPGNIPWPLFSFSSTGQAVGTPGPLLSK